MHCFISQVVSMPASLTVFLFFFFYCSNPDKIREFIKNVYVERKYAGGKSSDKPPRDTQAINFKEICA